MPEYAWMIPGYVWSCLKVPEFVWMAFVLHSPIVIPYLKESQTVFLESKKLIFSIVAGNIWFCCFFCFLFFESCQSNINLFAVGTKLKESMFDSSNQIDSTVTTRTWFVLKEWIRTYPNTGLVSEWNGGGTLLIGLNGRYCSSGCVGIFLY